MAHQATMAFNDPGDMVVADRKHELSRLKVSIGGDVPSLGVSADVCQQRDGAQ